MRFWVYILIPDILILMIARSVGYFFKVTDIRTAYPAEARVRGLLTEGRFGARKLSLGDAVQFVSERRISFGTNVTIYPGVHVVAGRHGYVRIGSHSHVSRNSVLAGGGGISIGEHCKISSGVRIYTVTYDRSSEGLLRDAPISNGPVNIGSDVHIGANATILPGVTIGDNATVGAGAVVSRDVEPNTTVVGVPAKPLKKAK